MAHQVMWQSVCVTDTDGVDHYVHRGADVPKWVDDFTLMALTTSGALQVVDRDTPAEDKPAEDKPAEDEGDESVFLTPTEDAITPVISLEELAKPSVDDPKSAWVEFASDDRNPNRITTDQASSMTKSALVERFK